MLHTQPLRARQRLQGVTRRHLQAPAVHFLHLLSQRAGVLAKLLTGSGVVSISLFLGMFLLQHGQNVYHSAQDLGNRRKQGSYRILSRTEQVLRP